MVGFGVHELIIVLMVMSLLAGPFWVFAILDILKSHFRENGKTIWLLIVVFLGIPGIILYRTIGRKQKITG